MEVSAAVPELSTVT